MHYDDSMVKGIPGGECDQSTPLNRKLEGKHLHSFQSPQPGQHKFPVVTDCLVVLEVEADHLQVDISLPLLDIVGEEGEVEHLARASIGR